MSNSKPVVHYDLDRLSIIEYGSGAIIHPLDHTSDMVSNTKASVTSFVISIDGLNFETENTKYIGVHKS